MARQRMKITFPPDLINTPLVYNMGKEFQVVTNIRRANVEAHSGWVILQLSGAAHARDEAIAYLEGLGCAVNRMEGDVVAG